MQMIARHHYSVYRAVAGRVGRQGLLQQNRILSYPILSYPSLSFILFLLFIYIYLYIKRNNDAFVCTRNVRSNRTQPRASMSATLPVCGPYKEIITVVGG